MFVHKSKTTFQSLSRVSCLQPAPLLTFSRSANRGLLYITKWSSTCLDPSSVLHKKIHTPIYNVFYSYCFTNCACVTLLQTFSTILLSRRVVGIYLLTKQVYSWACLMFSWTGNLLLLSEENEQHFGLGSTGQKKSFKFSLKKNYWKRGMVRIISGTIWKAKPLHHVRAELRSFVVVASAAAAVAVVPGVVEVIICYEM